jgi:hypothetical protein
LATTRFFLWSVFGVVTITLGFLSYVLARGYSNLEQLSRGVDIVVKVMAVLGGGSWALNRYYMSRSDVPQLKIESALDLVEGHEFSPPSESDLLLYRLDIVNTGKTVIPSFQQAIIFEAVFPGGTEARYEEIHRWPEHGMHLSGEVEPGSWSAVNSALPISASVVAIRIFIDLVLEGGSRWTWHRTFRVRGKAVSGGYRRNSDANSVPNQRLQRTADAAR